MSAPDKPQTTSQKDQTDKTAEPAKAVEPPKPVDVRALLIGDLRRHIVKIRAGVEAKEARHLQRALRQVFSVLRKKITASVLREVLSSTFPAVSEQLAHLTSYLPEHDDTERMDVDTGSTGSAAEKPTPTPVEPPKEAPIPEVEVFAGLLVLLYLVDHKRKEDAVKLSTHIVSRLESWNRRSLDPLSSKVYFYYSLSHEMTNSLASIRPKLLQLLRTATLRHNSEGQTTLLTLLLRNLVHYNLYDQADKLLSKTEFKEESAASNELARYYFYQGCIKAVQLNYSEAFISLQQALRKAPQFTANGFRASVLKFSIIVQMLMGEIPERNVFRQKGTERQLAPYFELVQSVRSGDINAYHKAVETHTAVFKQDKTLNLIHRMRNNVIKTGLRKINLSYSRISLADICTKLNLESVDDAEFIVAKAIRDGIIDATVNHEKKYMQSKEVVDIYATQEPQQQFQKRIQFCLDLHNDLVKAMRYKPGKKVTESEDAKKIRQEEEDVVAALEGDEMDEDDFF